MAIEKKVEGEPSVEQPVYPAQEHQESFEAGASQPEGERNEQKSPVQEEAMPVQAPVSVPIETPVYGEEKDPYLVQIENVLSEDMAELYGGLPLDIQPIFKAKGEEVALKIQAMFVGAQVAVKKVLFLIREWLGLVPNMNKFYLEQESKIKTDKIMELVNRSPENDTIA